MHLTSPLGELQFLGDGHCHRQALYAAEHALDLALSSTDNAPSPPDTQEKHHPLHAEKVSLDTPLDSFEEALTELNQLWLSEAVRYDSPRYLAHLNCPITPAGFAGAVISAGLNTAVESWDQSRGAALIEDRLVRWAAELAGMNPKRATGVFTSGGTQSNLQALYTAREKALAEGASLSSLRVLCSPEAHHSIARSAHLLGLSTQVIPTVEGNPNAGMDLEALRRTIASITSENSAEQPANDVQRQPSASSDRPAAAGIACLVLTAGTTDLGVVDPLDDALRIAEEHELYVHVDCAYGGALLLSENPERRALLAGLERANSFSLDFHKSFFQPLSCSALIYRDQADMDFVTCHADYLNPSEDSRLNLADRSLQTTRRFDALKLWLSLRVEGSQKLGQAFDTCCDIARATAGLIREYSDLELFAEPTLSTVLFRYIPTGSQPPGRRLGNSEATGSLAAPDDVDLNALNEAIRRNLFDTNQLIIASTLRDGESYLKFTILNPQLTHEDIRCALDIMCREGARQLQGDLPKGDPQ